MPRSVLDGVLPFPATIDGDYHPRLAELRGLEASGVYAILTTREVLYVGESHTGRLFDTITRHFREWRPRRDPQGRRRGGTMYDRAEVMIVFAITEPDVAQAAQYVEIQRLAPRDNEVDGHGLVEDAGELPPF